jgi:hypothetical protein
MQSNLDGSPVKVFKLAAQAAPNGGVIAMRNGEVMATAVREHDKWSVKISGTTVAILEGNASVPAAFLHGWFMSAEPRGDE